MTRKLLKRVKKVNLLDEEKLIDENIGIEIQEFINTNLSNEDIRKRTDIYIKKLKNFKGIKVLHGPFFDLNPISADRTIREVSYEEYKKAMEISKEIDVDYLIFHSQINSCILTPRIKEYYKEENKKFWNWIIKDMNYKGMILLENIYEKDPFILKEVIESINLDNVRINLDLEYVKLSKVELEIWIRELKDYIEIVHMHINQGLFDNNITLNEEEIEHLYKLLDKYNINPIISIENEVDEFEYEEEKYN